MPRVLYGDQFLSCAETGVAVIGCHTVRRRPVKVPRHYYQWDLYILVCGHTRDLLLRQQCAVERNCLSR